MVTGELPVTAVVGRTVGYTGDGGPFPAEISAFTHLLYFRVVSSTTDWTKDQPVYLSGTLLTCVTSALGSRPTRGPRFASPGPPRPGRPHRSHTTRRATRGRRDPRPKEQERVVGHTDDTRVFVSSSGFRPLGPGTDLRLLYPRPRSCTKVRTRVAPHAGPNQRKNNI